LKALRLLKHWETTLSKQRYTYRDRSRCHDSDTLKGGNIIEKQLLWGLRNQYAPKT